MIAILDEFSFAKLEEGESWRWQSWRLVETVGTQIHKPILRNSKANNRWSLQSAQKSIRKWNVAWKRRDLALDITARLSRDRITASLFSLTVGAFQSNVTNIYIDKCIHKYSSTCQTSIFHSYLVCLFFVNCWNLSILFFSPQFS